MLWSYKVNSVSELQGVEKKMALQNRAISSKDVECTFCVHETSIFKLHTTVLPHLVFTVHLSGVTEISTSLNL